MELNNNLSQMVQVVSPGCQLGEDITQVGSSKLEVGPLKCHWHPMEDKGKNPVLPVATVIVEYHLLNGISGERDLPIPLSEAQGGNKLGLPKLFDKVIHSGNRVVVELQDGIQLLSSASV